MFRRQMINVFQRVERCWGVTLWRGRGLRVELWVCLEGLRAHRHPGQDVEVMPLLGWASFWRRNPARNGKMEIKTGCLFRWLSIPAGWVHGFDVWHRPLVFLNRTFDGRSAAANMKRPQDQGPKD